MSGAALVHIFRHEPPAAADYAGRALRICEEHRIAQYHAYALCVNGWALGASGESEKGLAQIGQGRGQLRSWDAANISCWRCRPTAQLAIGKPEAALAIGRRRAEGGRKDGGSAA